MNAITEQLNKNVANLQVLYVKLHNYHWNVKGPQFFSIHNATEEYYNYISEQYDALAERVLQLGDKPLTTMKEYLKTASLQENERKQFSAQEVIENVLADFQLMLGEFEQLSRLASENGDTTTTSLADGNVEWLEKTIWMLKAHSE